MKLAILFLFVLAAALVVIQDAESAKRKGKRINPKGNLYKPIHQLGSVRNPKRQAISKHSTAKVQSTPHKIRNTTSLKRKRPRSCLGGGPHSFDYLLGVDEYFATDAAVVFLDHDTEQSVIQQFKNAGKTVICYVNVGAWEEWRSDAGAFPESVLGNDYDGWPGERWLDIRRHDILFPIMQDRYWTAASKGCEGIDPDNMNGYSVDTGFALTYQDQIAYNELVSELAHWEGMLAGLKNDNEQASDLAWAVDFAVLEQCAAYDECWYFDEFIAQNKPVFAVEYTDAYDEDEFWEEVCPLVDETGMSFILKDYDLLDDFIVSCL